VRAGQSYVYVRATTMTVDAKCEKRLGNQK